MTAVILLLTTNRACSHPPYFELTQHLSLSAPQDLSAPLHPFTYHVSFHLSTHHSSFYLWPNTRLHQLPTALTASHPPFNTIIYFFQTPLAPLIPSPCLNLPPQSVYLCLKPSYPSLLLTHPPCYFAVSSACTKQNRRFYLQIWHHSHLPVFVCRCRYLILVYLEPKLNMFKLCFFLPRINVFGVFLHRMEWKHQNRFSTIHLSH